MLLQRGKFLINNISELENLETHKDGLKRIIDLSYMGQFEFEGNAIPISRMFMELEKDNYQFYPISKFDSTGNQMYFYFNSKKLKELGKDIQYLEELADRIANREYSLYEYMKYSNGDYVHNFWWDIRSGYFIFFGQEKKDLINYFIDGCYERDGKEEGIQKSLRRAGYKP